jgi:hypothetical protein
VDGAHLAGDIRQRMAGGGDSVTSVLWAVEAKLRTQGSWILLPNLIFVDRKSTEWELGRLEPDEEYSGFRLVRYDRIGARYDRIGAL